MTKLDINHEELKKIKKKNFMKGLFFQEKYYFCIRNDNKITNLYMKNFATYFFFFFYYFYFSNEVKREFAYVYKR